MSAESLRFLSKFDTLFSKNIPHILDKIFLSLDYESYKNCLEVSNDWRGLLTSESYKTRGRSVYKEEILEDQIKLKVAAEENNTVEARGLLSSGMVDVNCKDDNKLTPLHKAAAKGHGQVAQLLLDKGASPNALDGHMQTPLHWAAMWGHTEMARLLIEYGALIMMYDNWGRTALHWAARHGHKDLAQLLVESGAEPNVTGEREGGRTPLHWAGKNDHKQICKLLIENGADPNVVDEQRANSTALCCY